MKRHPGILLALITLLAGTLSAAAAADFEWSGQIAAGKAIQIKGINGDIKAEATESGKVEVTAVKSGKDADKVRVEASENGDGVVVKAIYPKTTMGNFKASVEFTVRVPAGVRFVGKTVNGDIKATALDSEVEAATVNGTVRVSTSQKAEAKTVNGAVFARIDDGGLQHPLALESVNGRITVDAPEDLNAKVEASTVHGDIETDLPMTVKGKWGMHSMSGAVGSGGSTLAMRTVNGHIELRHAEQ
jgi:DUF4097 and DUF4098 domain-containing protein YvlB